MINLIINNKKVEVEDGTMILEAIKTLGIGIPTLCYHKALSSYGACRLCIVEMSAGKRPWIATSCTYPAQEGLVVKTHSEKVLKNRRIIVELLLARCPDSQQLKDLAKELGVTKVRLRPKNEDCTLCGLCIRMCNERMGIGVIGFVNRGSKRKVIPSFDALSDICQTCGACASVCPTGKIKIEEISKNKPIPILSEFDEGLRQRSPIYIHYPQAVPNRATIDKDYCVHMLKDECGICEKVCEAGAINYEQKEERIDLNVGSIILAPGFDKFKPGLKYPYGYGKYKNVVTSLEFERILSASGPTTGHIIRLSDGREAKKIAFIQCIGSREADRTYCSSVCCMYTTKHAIIAKEHQLDLECHIFYIDMRAYGKGFDEYFERAKSAGIKYTRCKPSAIKEVPGTHNLKFRYQTEEGQLITEEFDMVVLSTAMKSAKDIQELSNALGINLNEYGFIDTNPFSPIETNKEGIYVAGVITEPKDIPETVMQSSAASARVAGLLADSRGSLITVKEFSPERDVSGEELRIGVFVCHCGLNIAGVVNVQNVVEYAKSLPNVVYVENNLYTCSDDAQKNIKEKIQEHNLNRVVVASCTPRTHEPLFQNTLREAGLNPYLFEMANIRDQNAWVHMFEPENATIKAKDLVRMAITKVRFNTPLYPQKISISRNALVIGGGLSGIIASLNLADAGFDVFLIEKEKELGGNLNKIHFTLEGNDTKVYLSSLLDKLKQNKKINVMTSASITNTEGSIGNFTTKIVLNGGPEQEIQHGIIIVATGAQEYKPTQYLYGENERVITQLELEKQLAVNGAQFLENNAVNTVVMVQCVGSRDEERQYCSRVCCLEAIKNALKIKELSPKTSIYILYRDIRAYGFKESYYRKAREAGIIFVRYNETQKPEVMPISNSKTPLQVTVVDQVLGMPIDISTDLVVLSTAIVPREESKGLAQVLKVPLNQNGFFLEAHMKLRPVDCATDGIFLCGLAHSPKLIEESIIQASAAAGRAITVLAKDFIELGTTISQVIDENCDGCAYCVEPCPYKAITLIEYEKDGVIKKKVEVNESLCKGCGTCMATCPKQGIYVRNFKLEQLREMSRSGVAGPRVITPKFEPLIIAFCCSWCSYAGADLAGVSRIQYSTNIRIIRVMCSGMVHPNLVIDTLAEGADGVLVCGCHIGDCHYSEGNYKTLSRIPPLKNMVEQFGIDPRRVRLEWISAAEGKRFAEVVNEFTQQITELGPLGKVEV